MNLMKGLKEMSQTDLLSSFIILTFMIFILTFYLKIQS